MGKKRKMPCYRSRLQSRCEELAKRLSDVSSDYNSALGALREMLEAGFAEGYERKGFDLRYQREQREEKRKKEWVKLRDKIVFRGK
jgi:hypothetical protein